MMKNCKILIVLAISTCPYMRGNRVTTYSIIFRGKIRQKPYTILRFTEQFGKSSMTIEFDNKNIVFFNLRLDYASFQIHFPMLLPTPTPNYVFKMLVLVQAFKRSKVQKLH